MRRGKQSKRGRGKNSSLARARERMAEKGTLGSYGHHSVSQMERDKDKGGKIARKANFALNMHRIAAKRKRRGSTSRS